MILEEVIDKIDDSSYSIHMMFDLPEMLQSNQITINNFFNISSSD